jgi:hypothetical protein
MSISLSMVQMGAWVSIERVVSPPEGSVRQTWTTRWSNPPWGSVSQTLPTHPLREVSRQLPIKWRTHHVNRSRQVCETNPGPTHAYVIPDSLRETLRCVQTLLLPHPVPKELPSLDPRTINQAVRDSRQFLGMDITDDKDSHQTREIPGIESILRLKPITPHS